MRIDQRRPASEWRRSVAERRPGGGRGLLSAGAQRDRPLRRGCGSKRFRDCLDKGRRRGGAGIGVAEGAFAKTRRTALGGDHRRGGGGAVVRSDRYGFPEILS